MPTPQKTTGNRGENEALQFLTQQGLRLREKNFSCYFGEIDLIMQDTHHIVFVEVRCRALSSYGNATNSITPAKIKKLIKAATCYLQLKKCLHKVHSRFDIVAIDFNSSKKEISWLKNAFTT
jgi:putative endonuclease